MRQWLRDARKAKNMTEGAVAAAAGITQVAYHLIETGERKPRPETAMKIAAAIGFPWTRFYEEDEKSVNVDALGEGT